MILKIDGMRIDVDQVSFMYEENHAVVVGSTWCTLLEEDWEILKKAFDWIHESHIYDKNLKKTKGGK